MNIDLTYHFPPDLMGLLIDTIPLLIRTKKDMLGFFRGAGVATGLTDLWNKVSDPREKETITKYEITREVLKRLNEKGDTAEGIRQRREVLKRVVEFEDFSVCWPNDQLKAKGLVGEIRRLVHVVDSFRRMQNEKEDERRKRSQALETEAAQAIQRREEREAIKGEFFRLF